MNPVWLSAGLLLFASLRTDAAEHVVSLLPDLSFSAPNLVVAPGDTVRFENVGGFHNIREVASEASAAPAAKGFCAPQPDCAASGAAWSGVIGFPQAGVFHYWCEIHGSAMRGTITVRSAAP